jgi:phage terminase large subunit GpA-like protein
MLNDIILSAGEMLRPPRRIPVSEAAEKFLVINHPGGYAGPWMATLTPYMIEPMNRLTDRKIEAVVFVGPARTGKTEALVDAWLTYAVCCDPGDMMILHMTEATARDYSRRRMARLHRHSPEISKRLSPFANDDNVFDKHYRSGMILSIGWPSASQLSGRDLRYVAMTDYDRYPDDIDGEGDAFSLGRKRTQTFLSGGRVLVESSPGREIGDAKWQPTNPHDAPPCGGVFSLYNRGDRRRWYWPCPDCHMYFTAAPGPESFVEVDGVVHLICPHCGIAIHGSYKSSMNSCGRWLAAGQSISPDGEISGEIPATTIASYWLTGPAAAFQNWDSMALRYRQAEQDLERTGSEEALRAVTTTDFGMAFRPRQLHVARDPRQLQDRVEDCQKHVIPESVKFLTAAVDVQVNRFVVQVVGWGKNNERWLIDRYNLRWSNRKDSKGESEPINPAARIEDWWVLIDEVLMKPYPFATDPTSGLLPVMVAIDSGGKAGVTERTYTFWRQARRQGYSRRIMLVKGSGRWEGARISRTYPDSSKRQDRKANARGEIPVWQLNIQMLKDTLVADLERLEPGPGYIHFPAWLGNWFFDELTAETRTTKGWQNLGGGRNEAMDLMVYNHAAMLSLNAERLDWTHPPSWADPALNKVPVLSDRVTTTGPAQTVASSTSKARRPLSFATPKSGLF